MKMLIGTIAICLGWLCSFGALAEENGGGCTFDVPLPPDPLPESTDPTAECANDLTSQRLTSRLGAGV